MEPRVYNFSPGPAVLPVSVLEEAQRDLLSLPGVGVSALEISHRCPWFDKVLAETEANLRQLLAIPANYRVLFMQGGSRLQFSMVPMNLLRGTGKSADYIVTGSWGQMAMTEAQRDGEVRAAYNGKPTNFDRLPQPGELKLDPNAAYVHLTSNETIQGVQFAGEPNTGAVPLVCDASSDFMHRPLPIERYGLIYACAQKNAGPAGVTVVIVRDDLLERSKDDLPTMLNYKVVRGREIAVEHAARVCDLYRDAGHTLAAEGHRRPGQDARDQSAQSGPALRRDRLQRRILPGACPPRLPIADERHLQAARRPDRKRLRQAGRSPRVALSQGAPFSRRYPSLDLQRHAHGRRRGLARLHGGIQEEMMNAK